MRKLSLREKLLLGSLLVIVCMGIFYTRVVTPLHRQRDTLMSSNANLEREIGRRENLLRQEPQLKGEIHELNNLLADDPSPSITFSYVLVLLEEVASQLGVSLQGLNIDGVGPGGGSISMSVSGGYTNVQDYLHMLESRESGIILHSARMIGQGAEAAVSISATVVSGEFVSVPAQPLERLTPFGPR